MIVWSPGVTLEDVEKQAILKALDHFRWNKTATASALGISVRTLDARIEKYDEEKKAEAAHQVELRRQRDDYLARARGQAPTFAPVVAVTVAPALPAPAPVRKAR